MSTIVGAKQAVNTNQGQYDGTHLHKWSALNTGDVGDGVELPGLSDKTVQVVGTFGGATVSIQGSLDGVNFSALNDPSGAAIALTAAGMVAIVQNVRFLRPSVAGGAGANLDIWLLSRQP